MNLFERSELKTCEMHLQMAQRLRIELTHESKVSILHRCKVHKGVLTSVFKNCLAFYKNLCSSCLKNTKIQGVH